MYKSDIYTQTVALTNIAFYKKLLPIPNYHAWSNVIFSAFVGVHRHIHSNLKVKMRHNDSTEQHSVAIIDFAISKINFRY